MAEGFLPPVVAVMTANISEFSAKMAEARGEMDATTKQGGGKFKALGKLAQGALIGMATAAVAVGVTAVHMADQYETSHALLVNAVVDSHHKFSDFSKEIDAQRGPWERLGKSQAQYEGALALLVQATQSPKEAIKDMGVVANLAAARHMDLNKAAILVGKVAQGNTSVLRRYGIDLGITAGGATKVKSTQDALAKSLVAYQQLLDKDHAKKKLTLADHFALQNALQKVKDNQTKLNVVNAAGALGVAALGDRMKGAASAAAGTFAGQMKALQATSENLLKDLGLKLIPVLQKVLDFVMRMVTWFEKHQAAAKALGIAVLGLAAALAVAGAVAFVVENILTLGIGLAIAALVVGIIYLADHWKQIWGDIQQWTSDALNAVASAVHAVVGPVIAWIQGVMQPFTTWWEDHWTQIQHVVHDVWHLIELATRLAMSQIEAVIKIGMAAIRVVWDLWPAIYALAKTVWDLLVGMFKSAWDLISTIFATARDVILGIVGVLLDIITGKWGAAWNDIKTMVANVWSDITSGIGHFLSNIVSTITGFVSDVYNAAKSIGSAIVNGIVDAIKGLAGSIPGALGGILNNIPGVGILKKVPGLSWLASGGVALANHPYVVGEQGPELLIPSSNSRIVPNHQLGGTGSFVTASGQTIHVAHMEITVVAPESETAGASVIGALSDADFLHARN